MSKRDCLACRYLRIRDPKDATTWGCANRKCGANIFPVRVTKALEKCGPTRQFWGSMVPQKTESA